MIKYVKLRFFRKHEDATFELTQGLNALRGPNEHGKSTIIEGICYALFGSRALRDTLAETVTWGHKESELRVEMLLTQAGVDYLFTRSKSGAEVNYGSSKVVGQNEVTAFASQLLGCDAKTANALMLASQNGLRGALDEGPAAVSGLMSKLADFDLIDRLVEAAQGNLVLGAEGPAREKLEAAKARVTALEQSEPTGAKVEFFADLVQQAQQKLADLEADQPRVAAVAEGCRSALDRATASNLERVRKLESRSGAVAALARTKASIDAVQQKLLAKPDPEALVSLDQQIEQAKQLDAARAVHARISGLNPYPAVYWEGSQADFLCALYAAREAADTAKFAEHRLKISLETQRKKRITSDKCPTCGRASMNDEHVAKHNADVEAEVKDIEAQLAKATAKKEAAVTELAEMEALQRSAAKFDEVAASLVDCTLPEVKIYTDKYPPCIKWSGSSPSPVDLKGLQEKRKQLVAAQHEAARAEGELKVLQESLASQEEAIVKLDSEISALPEVDLTPLNEAYAEASNALSALINEIAQTSVLVQGYRQQQAAAEQEIETYKADLQSSRNLVELCEAELQQLIRNNLLLAKLRKLKPAITDYLWGQVLAAVSNFFTQLRGESSVVTKTAQGFRVNDHSISSLSGSTLDVLALAIRVALTKTFIPGASFIVLDEPAAGCDVSRTGGLLGFLASIGFSQTILASHDELSESVADRVILLGASE